MAIGWSILIGNYLNCNYLGFIIIGLLFGLTKLGIAYFSKNKLQKKANVELYKGFTKKTLKNFTKNNSKKIDFIFIDGGHSIKTITNDWTYIKKLIHKKSITIFDDYYLNNKRLIKFYGCNKIIDNLENVFQFKKLLFTDNFFNMNKKLFIKMVKVSFLKNN
jgi:hypothetical protein